MRGVEDRAGTDGQTRRLGAQTPEQTVVRVLRRRPRLGVIEQAWAICAQLATLRCLRRGRTLGYRFRRRAGITAHIMKRPAKATIPSSASSGNGKPPSPAGNPAERLLPPIHLRTTACIQSHVSRSLPLALQVDDLDRVVRDFQIQVHALDEFQDGSHLRVQPSRIVRDARNPNPRSSRHRIRFQIGHRGVERVANPPLQRLHRPSPVLERLGGVDRQPHLQRPYVHGFESRKSCRPAAAGPV